MRWGSRESLWGGDISARGGRGAGAALAEGPASAQPLGWWRPGKAARRLMKGGAVG